MDREEARQVLEEYFRQIPIDIDVDEADVAGSPTAGWIFRFEGDVVYMVHPGGEVSCVSPG